MSPIVGSACDTIQGETDGTVFAQPTRKEHRPHPGFCEKLRSSTPFTLGLLTLVVVLLYADQNLLAPNLSAVAEEFGFDEQEKDIHLGGDCAMAFFGFGAPASLIVGLMADTVDRRKLFVVIAMVGAVGALATVFCTTFSQLYWARAVTGIAIGGGMPLVYGMMGDLVANTRRAEASGMVHNSFAVGMGLGQVIGGLTGSSTKLGWRLPFLLVAVPCLALNALVFVTTRDPARGRQEAGLQEHFEAGGQYTERINLQGVRMLASSPTVVLMVLQGIAGALPWGVIIVFLPDFLHSQRGLTIEAATLIVTMFVAGTITGTLVGAKLGQKLYNRRARLQPLFMGTTTIAGSLPCIMLLRYAGGVVGLYALFAITGGFVASMTGPNTRSVLMNVTLPSTRGTAFGVINLFDELGKGLGPIIVSRLAARTGRETAFTVAMVGWLVCGTMFLAIALTVQHDENKVQLHLAEYGRQSSDSQSRASKGTPLLSSGAILAAAKYAAVSDNFAGAHNGSL